MIRLWCELAWLGGDSAEPGVALTIEQGRIAAVERTPAPAPDEERLAGVTIPGLANAHSHAFQRALRARAQTGEGTFWTWRDQMYALAERLDPEPYLRLARATFGEMALAGITLVGEFHYVHHGPDGRPYDDPNAMGEAVAQAAREAGLRMTLLDACYLHGGFGVAASGVQSRFADGSVSAWAERVERLVPQPALRIGAAIHSVRAVDPDSARVVAEWARDRGVPLHAHVSEQPAENEACYRAHGMTPTALLDSAGAVTQPFTAVHATHVSAEDIALLGRAGATCCLCPTTERDLADGIGEAMRLRHAGARLALGSDSHAVIDLLEEARAVELDERLTSGRRGLHTAADLLDAATAHGYASLGWPEGGVISVGAPADLVNIPLEGVRLAGALPGDALTALVFAAGAADVRHVMVDGRWIVRDGRHAALDVAGELSAALAR